MADMPSGGDMSKMIEQLMADEKFGEILNTVKKSFSANADNGQGPSSSDENTSDNKAEVLTDTEPPIPSIPKLSPELLSKLPEIMGMLSGDGNLKSDPRLEDRKRLLKALKPFLSENRRNAVDSIVNIAGIADLFGI